MPTGYNSKGELVTSALIVSKALPRKLRYLVNPSAPKPISYAPPISLTFDIREPDRDARTATIVSSSVKIGKLKSSALRIHDEHVSRMHAVIENKGDEVVIIDLGSTTGTLVNGKTIRKAVLCNDDVIQVGRTKITIDGIPDYNEPCTRD